MDKRDLKVDLGIARGMKPLNTSEYYEGISLETAQQYMMAAEGWPHAIERALEAEAKLEKAKDLIQRWFDGEIGAFGVMDALIIDLEFDIDGIPDEALEYHNIKRKEVLVDEA